MAAKIRDSDCFALYKGDDLLAFGTLSEISVKTGKSMAWLRYMLYPHYTKRLKERNSKVPLVLVPAEGDNINEYEKED